MIDAQETWRTLVADWITDCVRRGAELYAKNQGEESEYFSLLGKDQRRFSVEVDYAAKDLVVQITEPETSRMERRTSELTAEHLRLLAKQICLVKEGQVIVPTYLLAQLSIICHAYQRLIQDFDREHRIQTSTTTIVEVEEHLKQFLTAQERQRTNNPLLAQARAKESESETANRPTPPPSPGP